MPKKGKEFLKEDKDIKERDEVEKPTSKISNFSEKKKPPEKTPEKSNSIRGIFTGKQKNSITVFTEKEELIISHFEKVMSTRIEKPPYRLPRDNKTKAVVEGFINKISDYPEYYHPIELLDWLLKNFVGKVSDWEYYSDINFTTKDAKFYWLNTMKFPIDNDDRVDYLEEQASYKSLYNPKYEDGYRFREKNEAEMKKEISYWMDNMLERCPELSIEQAWERVKIFNISPEWHHLGISHYVPVDKEVEMVRCKVLDGFYCIENNLQETEKVQLKSLLKKLSLKEEQLDQDYKIIRSLLIKVTNLPLKEDLQTYEITQIKDILKNLHPKENEIN